jgi:hypothetical protein
MDNRIFIPLSEFVKRQDEVKGLPLHHTWAKEFEKRFKMIINYTNFITQTIILGQFIPCDKEGNVLEKPKEHLTNRSLYYKEFDQYQEAKERVLFKGFEVDRSLNGFLAIYTQYPVKYIYSFGKFRFKTIEDLTHLNLELTDNALNK